MKSAASRLAIAGTVVWILAILFSSTAVLAVGREASWSRQGWNLAPIGNYEDLSIPSTQPSEPHSMEDGIETNDQDDSTSRLDHVVEPSPGPEFDPEEQPIWEEETDQGTELDTTLAQEGGLLYEDPTAVFEDYAPDVRDDEFLSEVDSSEVEAEILEDLEPSPSSEDSYEDVEDAAEDSVDDEVVSSGSGVLVEDTMLDPSIEPTQVSTKQTRRVSDLILELSRRSLASNHSLALRDEIAALRKSDPSEFLEKAVHKVPAIQRSPDVSRQVQAAAADDDPGLAACVLGTLAYLRQFNASMGIHNRRVEQLVECILCGGVPLGSSNQDPTTLDQSPGLSIRDACRAVWGLATLTSLPDTIAEHSVDDIVQALGARVCRLLLGQLQLLQQSDMRDDSTSLLDERLHEFIETLAEDAASVMWAFSYHSDTNHSKLMDLATLILSQDPRQIRMDAQQQGIEVGVSDVVERLAEAEEGDLNITQAEESSESVTNDVSRTILLDWLSENERVDVLWATTLRGLQTNHTHLEYLNITADVDVFISSLFDRSVEWLRKVASFLRLESAGSLDAKLEVEYVAIDRVDDNATESADSMARNESEPDTIVAPDMIERQAQDTYIEDVTANQAPDDNVEQLDDDMTIAFPLPETVDLVTIAWGAAELHAQEADRIVNLVEESVGYMGRDSVLALSANDLTNMAWAFVKRGLKSLRPSLLEWILEGLQSKLGQSQSMTLDEILCPSQESRLLWSLAMLHERVGNLTTLDGGTVASQSLLNAATYAVRYSEEDVGRILYAYLTLHGYPSLPEHVEAVALLSTVLETKVLQWERCEDPAASRGRSKQSGFRRFVSFLGRSRSILPFLDTQVDDEANHNNSSMTIGEHRLPRLGDLPVDPLTLTKVASSLVMTVPNHYPTQLMRLSMRLLSSKSGRLLQECPLEEITRMLEAMAHASSGEHRELTCYFVRKCLQVINLQPKSQDTMAIIRLYLALSKLGCRLAPQDDAATAYRRLHVIAVPDVDIKQLSPSHQAQWVRTTSYRISNT